MIRNELERRGAEKRAEYLRSELKKRAVEERPEAVRGVVSALRMQLSDIEDELAEYGRLKEGLTPILEGESLDDLGKLIIKARIARGWSQADLAEALEMEPQQVQRYERNDWQKISLWRLQEVTEVLGLRFDIHAYLLREHEMEGPGVL